MTRCPKCGKPSVRVMVNLILDIPGELLYGLSKAALRRKDVRVDGANWEKARLYCTRSACNWILPPAGERT